MSVPYLISLSETRHVPDLGAKISGIRWLSEHGVPVPHTSVCLPTAHDLALSDNPNKRRLLRRAITEIIDPGGVTLSALRPIWKTGMMYLLPVSFPLLSMCREWMMS